MKCLNPIQILVRRALLFLGKVLLSLGILLGALSCSPVDQFSEYRGVNLLEGISLSNWQLDPDNPTYLLYENAGVTAGYNQTEAYRLRTINLFPNGDFESFTVGASPDFPWNLQGAGSAFTIIQGTSAIQSKSLQYNLISSEHYITFPLSSLTDGFLTNTPYTFRFHLKFTTSTLSFDINTSSADYQTYFLKIQKPNNEKAFYLYPEDFPESPLAQYVERQSSESLLFYLNTRLDRKEAQSGYIDNIRFLRSDLLYRIHLTLNKNEPNRLPLPSGSYRFSFYVKQDFQVGANNVLPASRISFGIGSAAKAMAAPSVESDWSLVSEVFHNLQIDPGSTLTLWISATDFTNDFTRDCGSILISNPVLEFLPEGN
ncbi:MAG: hypothetical protein SNJ78_08850 [Spirochaetales bacterium]